MLRALVKPKTDLVLRVYDTCEARFDNAKPFYGSRMLVRCINIVFLALSTQQTPNPNFLSDTHIKYPKYQSYVR